MTTELEICKDKLRTKTAEFEEFIYIVSHDVKAPLRAISNLAAWIEDDLGDTQSEDVRENMKLLKNRVNRIERMISALTDISRINRMELDKREVDVEKLCIEIIEENPASDSISFEIGEMPVFETYNHKIKRVFSELISNAVNFQNGSNVKIQIEAEKTDSFYTFKIKDNGIGIPADAIEKVKKIFYTVHIKDDLDTTGAGLTIADKIIGFVGGTLDIQSKINEGTTVSFSWPI